MILLKGAAACLAAVLLTAPVQAETSATAASQSARPPKIPSAVFAEQAAFTNPKISPNGDRLLVHIEKDGKEYVGVDEIATGKMKMIQAPDNGEIAWSRWAGDDRVIVSIASTGIYFGEEARVTRLAAYDVSTGAIRFIGDKHEGPEGDDVLYVDPSGDWLLLSFQKSFSDYPSVHRVELATNKMKQIVPQQQSVWEWYADDQGVVRAGIGFGDRTWSMVYRKTDGEYFKKVGEARYDDDKAALDLLHFALDSDEGYILSNEKTGRYALYKYNFATRELGALVYENPTNDVTDFDLATDGKTVKAVWFTDERDRVVWFDDNIKKYQDAIDAALKDRLNWILSRSRDDSRMLVWTGSASDPGAYYVFAPQEGRMKRFAKLNEHINVKQLAPTRYVHYPARDGLEIPAYLTLPVGRDPKNLPLVILPHGGPYGVRDTLSYDPEVQFLANRGYAVLQPNYRGSPTYGDEFYKRGEGQWGRQMQDDLDDGMDWLAKQGTVDTKRVCIVGGSYGGYAALWGATRNPERYRCAASYAGVTDLRRQLNYQTDFLISRRYRKDWRSTVQGQKDFDLDSVSPLKQVDRLQVPVLVVHGDADQTVPYKQSSLYAAALQKAGKKFEFHTYKDEIHGFSSAATLTDWLDRLEAFLTRYNPAD